MAEMDERDCRVAPLRWCNNMTKHSNSDRKQQKQKQAAAAQRNLQCHHTNVSIALNSASINVFRHTVRVLIMINYKPHNLGKTIEDVFKGPFK